MTPLDRRDFVKTGTGTALGMSLAPGAMLGRGGRERADRLRLGYIGMGGRGSWLLGLALRRDDTEVKAVCDIVPEKAQRAATAVREATGNEPRQFTAGEEDTSAPGSNSTDWGFHGTVNLNRVSVPRSHKFFVKGPSSSTGVTTSFNRRSWESDTWRIRPEMIHSPFEFLKRFMSSSTGWGAPLRKTHCSKNRSSGQSFPLQSLRRLNARRKSSQEVF